MADVDVIERRVSIAAPVERILPELVDLHRWVGWSPWEGLDPKLKRAYGGPGSGMGATYAWSGNRRAGAGRMRIVGVEPESIDIDVTFIRPFRSTSQVRFDLKPQDGSTSVVWTMRSPRTLGSRVLGLFMDMDRTIGADLDKGLAQLKALVEGSGG